MTEPVTAADVIEAWARKTTVVKAWRPDVVEMVVAQMRSEFADELAALREACGGGDIVIRTDGTLAALRPWSSINVIVDADGRESCNHGDSVSCDMVGHRTEPLWRVVPVERGA